MVYTALRIPAIFSEPVGLPLCKFGASNSSLVEEETSIKYSKVLKPTKWAAQLKLHLSRESFARERLLAYPLGTGVYGVHTRASAAEGPAPWRGSATPNLLVGSTERMWSLEHNAPGCPERSGRTLGGAPKSKS